MLGINNRCNLLLKKLEDSYPKTIFVNLDENVLVYPEKKIKKMLKFVPFLDGIKIKLREIYIDFNKQNNGFISSLQAKENKKHPQILAPVAPKSLIYNQNKSEDEKCKNILEIFKRTFENFTLKNLPTKPIFQQENENVNFIRNKIKI